MTFRVEDLTVRTHSFIALILASHTKAELYSSLASLESRLYYHLMHGGNKALAGPAPSVGHAIHKTNIIPPPTPSATICYPPPVPAHLLPTPSAAPFATRGNHPICNTFPRVSQFEHKPCPPAPPPPPPPPPPPFQENVTDRQYINSKPQ